MAHRGANVSNKTPSTLALDCLDSMHDGAEWTPVQLRDHVGKHRSLATECKTWARLGWIEEVSREVGAVLTTGIRTYCTYRITAQGRDVLAQEIAAGRIPGVS